VLVIDTAANTVVATITVVGFGAGVVAVSPDGSKVYVTSYDSTVCGTPGTGCSQA
jgi:DNA-binding beta-propeller fold protein YncE